MRAVAAALAPLAVAALLGGCTRGSTAHAPTPTPLVARPLPSTAASLTSELALVAFALERPGDDATANHERLQACIRLSRLREEAERKKLVPEDRLQELERADKACATDQASAASHVRTAARP